MIPIGQYKFHILGGQPSEKTMIKIDSLDFIERTADYWHDAIFGLEQVNFNEKDKVFSMVIIRDIWEEAKVVEKKFLRTKYIVPRQKYLLTFTNVTKIELKATEPVDAISDISYNPNYNEIRIECAKNTRIVLKVEKLNGKLEEIGNKFFDNTKYYTTVFGIESVEYE